MGFPDKKCVADWTDDAGDGEMLREESIPEAIVKFRAVYKFHEGSSAAVRRGVKMSALM
jgi:hypothetical protein